MLNQLLGWHFSSWSKQVQYSIESEFKTLLPSLNKKGILLSPLAFQEAQLLLSDFFSSIVFEPICQKRFPFQKLSVLGFFRLIVFANVEEKLSG